MKLINSCLRYPGGKQKSINKITPYIPKRFLEYREPFVGGASLYLHIYQKYPCLKFWINDLNPDVACFWQQVRDELSDLVNNVKEIKQKYQDGKQLFGELKNVDISSQTLLEQATRFFVLNRISFSGTTNSGGFSSNAFINRFTNSSIARLENMDGLFLGTEITGDDYSELVNAGGENVFIYLDPPYFSAKKLYGFKGDLHTIFDHQRFANIMRNCHHKWLITYDDCEEVRKNFDFANIYPIELQYSMNNYKQNHAARGKELIITNYIKGG